MQFSEGQLGVKFKPFSKYPPCYNDISFWINDSFTENNLCELVRGIAGDLVEEAIFLIFAAKPLLHFMGVNYNYLTLRSLGAPAVLLSLAMQGVFQGFKDTKTPLYATLAGDLTNIALDPLFMFVFRLGVSAAAIAHVVSQYLISVILLWKLMQKVDLMPPSIKHLQFDRFLKNGFLLLMRVTAVTFCVTLATSLAARQGSKSMAAFQVCLQIWLAVSLLADGLAVAGQAILAGAFAAKDYDKATETAARVLQMGLVLGLALAFILGAGLPFGAKLFTRDVDVLHLIKIGIPFVAATQPINALAFVFDAYSGSCQHHLPTIFISIIHRNLGCFDHLYGS